ncbi:MAG: TadE/TadG family type IV pilus assembly protein [Xanthobacteraceae bacterium]
MTSAASDLFRCLRKLRAAWLDCSGTALIEGAIVIPIIFTLALGALEFSWFFYQSHLISTGVRDAARYLAKTTDPTNAANQADAKHLATSGEISGGAPRVNGWTDDDVSICIMNAANSACATNCRGNAQPVMSANPCGPGYSCRGSPVAAVVVYTQFPDPSLGFFSLVGLQPPTFCLWHEERILVDAPARS